MTRKKYGSHAINYDKDIGQYILTVVFHTAAARPAIPSVNSRPSLVSGRSLNVLELSA